MTKAKKTSEWEREAQEWMDKLSIIDLQMLNGIVYYKCQEAIRETLNKVGYDAKVIIKMGLLGYEIGRTNGLTPLRASELMIEELEAKIASLKKKERGE